VVHEIVVPLHRLFHLLHLFSGTLRHGGHHLLEGVEIGNFDLRHDGPIRLAQKSVMMRIRGIPIFTLSSEITLNLSTSGRTLPGLAVHDFADEVHGELRDAVTDDCGTRISPSQVARQALTPDPEILDGLAESFSRRSSASA
jgi:hypothetical protein